GGQVTGHRVDVVGQVLPDTGHPGHLGLSAKLALGTHLAGHARHFGGERIELVHHGVDGVLELQDFSLHVHRDLLVELAACHGRRPAGDVADLGRQVTGHRVDVVGEVLPDAAHALHVGLPAQLAFSADLTG